MEEKGWKYKNYYLNISETKKTLTVILFRFNTEDRVSKGKEATCKKAE